MHSKLHVKTFAELLSYSYVPKTGKLIFGKKVLPKMGHATIPGVGGFMSQKQGNSFSEKRFCQKWDMQQRIFAQNRQKWIKHEPKCPKSAKLFMRMSLFGTFLF